MVTVGADLHKRWHTAVAVDDQGRRLAERTVRATPAGHLELLRWAEERFPERRWALEDRRRHLSRQLERDLLRAGASVVRVSPRLMAGAAGCSSREPGRKRCRPSMPSRWPGRRFREPDLPIARLDGPERDVRLLVDHRDDLVAERTRAQNRLRWHLHELTPGERALPPQPRPAACPADPRGAPRRPAGYRGPHRLGARRPHPRADHEHRPPGARTRRPGGCPGPHAAGAGRLRDTHLGQARGGDPPRTSAASGRRPPSRAMTGPLPCRGPVGRQRHPPPTVAGWRRTSSNLALHRIAITQLQRPGKGQDYIAKRLDAGDTKTEAIRALRRRISDEVYRRMLTDATHRQPARTSWRLAASTIGASRDRVVPRRRPRISWLAGCPPGRLRAEHVGASDGGLPGPPSGNV